MMKETKTEQEFIRRWTSISDLAARANLAADLRALLREVRAAERERCATVADDCANDETGGAHTWDVAAAIRALKDEP
jgi:hypothetical protein